MDKRRRRVVQRDYSGTPGETSDVEGGGLEPQSRGPFKGGQGGKPQPSAELVAAINEGPEAVKRYLARASALRIDTALRVADEVADDPGRNAKERIAAARMIIDCALLDVKAVAKGAATPEEGRANVVRLVERAQVLAEIDKAVG